MSFSTGSPGMLQIVNGPAPAGAPVLAVHYQDTVVATHMERISTWVGAWQEQLSASPIQQRAWISGSDALLTANAPQVTLTTLGGRPAWSFADLATAYFDPSAMTLPASYTVYAVFRMDVADTIGLVGHADASGARMLLRADNTGALRLDHGAAAGELVTAATRWQLGATNVVWGAFDATTKGGRVGGTVAGVVDRAAAASATFASNHKAGSQFRIGNAGGFFGAHVTGDVIVASTDLTRTAPTAHAEILAALATKYGLTLAA